MSDEERDRTPSWATQPTTLDMVTERIFIGVAPDAAHGSDEVTTTHVDVDAKLLDPGVLRHDVHDPLSQTTEDERLEDGVTQTSLPPPASDTEDLLELDPEEILDASPPPETSDPETAELPTEGNFGALLAHYRHELAETERPSVKVSLFLRVAGVHEAQLHDANAAFDALVEAFEIAPDDAAVIAEIDRVGKASQRIGELADHVRQRLLPTAPEQKKATYLAHLVYWYERVLGRGGEVSSFVSEIERHDKVHPIVLKRAAEIAAMNGDVKTQREHLARALARTTRKEERVALHLALASAHAGTAEALKQYEAALALDPTSIVALQGVKRLSKESEQYAHVVWALEQQAEVAPTQAERADALLELAELQESKFLKREVAAELLEKVLLLEPSNPVALKGLERCYHATRDWPKLARVLGLRAEHTFDKSAKVELLELAAEVAESKLGDPAAAVDAYRDLLLVEPKHRRALGDLARLYEKLGDWANVATYKAQIVELAPTKRASSQELVKLGDWLNSPDRDPLAAKRQYERAVVVDPTNPAAWEAVQRFAELSGDHRLVIECLERRKDHTDAPRQRAVILVELAKAHRARGDDTAARECFEEAIGTDASNEEAAEAMLEAFAAEERWIDAAPLCELLVNAAVRDRDEESLFARLRLSTRIAAALGDTERSLTAAIAALDARPNDPEAQGDLVVAADRCRARPAALEKARPRLTELARHAEHLPTDQRVRLARIQRDLGDVDGAVALLEIARSAAPNDPDVDGELAEIYLAQADFPRACKLKVDMARASASANVRFELLCEAGEIWARRAGELEKAASVFEEARAIRPLDVWILQTMAWLYGELGAWERAIDALAKLTESDASAPDKVAALVATAEIARDRLGDRTRAADLYDAVLDRDKSRLDAFEALVRALTEEKDWERLERAYTRMIARTKGDGPSQLQFLLHHQLGLIYRDRLGDAARAYDALDAAARLEPENAEARKIVVELLVVMDDLDGAVARAREAIERTPHDAELYAELYDLFLRQRAFDKAWCTVNVLARLRAPTPEQRRFHEDYAPTPLDRVPGQLVEQAWKSHVFHADLDPALTTIFSLITPAVARIRYGHLRAEQRGAVPFTPEHSRIHDAIRRVFDDAAEILAMPSPLLLLGELAATAPFAPAIVSYGALLVCAPAVEAQHRGLVYLVGKRLAERRPELAARAFFPSVAELSMVLAAAVRVIRSDAVRDPTSGSLDASLTATLSRRESETLRSAVLAATAGGSALDVKRWFVAADLSSMRAGLLLTGDVGPARDAILAEPTASSDLSPREKVGELYKFATSDLYADLRGAIGVAVKD